MQVTFGTRTLHAWILHHVNASHTALVANVAMTAVVLLVARATMRFPVLMIHVIRWVIASSLPTTRTVMMESLARMISVTNRLALACTLWMIQCAIMASTV